MDNSQTNFKNNGNNSTISNTNNNNSLLDQGQFNLADLEKKILENRCAQELTNTYPFYIQDIRRSEFYKVEVRNGILEFAKQDQPAWSIYLDKLEELLDNLNEKVEPFQETHNFFSKAMIAKAKSGDTESLRIIFQDLINDNLRRVQLFDEIGIPESTKKVWFE